MSCAASAIARNAQMQRYGFFLMLQKDGMFFTAPCQKGRCEDFADASPQEISR